METVDEKTPLIQTICLVYLILKKSTIPLLSCGEAVDEAFALVNLTTSAIRHVHFPTVQCKPKGHVEP
ncbi:hypothetical protein [Aquirufa ecclesiirivi]|uniref:hypothetical protein n=1 Tax=Aquirufa ecclesiirivi TaxID=2715124 RepID=UPI003BB1EECE